MKTVSSSTLLERGVYAPVLPNCTQTRKYAQSWIGDYWQHQVFLQVFPSQEKTQRLSVCSVTLPLGCPMRKVTHLQDHQSQHTTEETLWGRGPESSTGEDAALPTGTEDGSKEMRSRQTFQSPYWRQRTTSLPKTSNLFQTDFQGHRDSCKKSPRVLGWCLKSSLMQKLLEEKGASSSFLIALWPRIPMSPEPGL